MLSNFEFNIIWIVMQIIRRFKTMAIKNEQEKIEKLAVKINTPSQNGTVSSEE